jgi:hypothetical protein
VSKQRTKLALIAVASAFAAVFVGSGGPPWP